MTRLGRGLAIEALRLFVRGDRAAGAARYRRALDAPGGWAVPVGLHARLLESSGHAEAAAWVRKAGLWVGADLSSSPLTRGADLDAAIEEYRALFANGIATAYMVALYMACLSLARRSDALAEVAAPGQLFRRTRLPVNGPIAPFLAGAAAALRRSHSRQFQAAANSVRNMERVPDTHALTDPFLVELHAAVRTLMTEYRRAIAQSGHPMARFLLPEFQLDSFALISDGTGYNVPHSHPGCWTVAVAYLEAGPQALAEGSDVGHLRVGPSRAGDQTCPGWPNLSVAPTPGTVVLMPAFYTHWTVPMPRPEGRISVVFNVCEILDATDENAPPW